jgi:putative protease
MNYRDSNQGVCNNACRFKYKTYKSDNPEYLEPLQSNAYKEVEKGTYFVEEEKRKGELYEVTEDETGTYIFNSKDNCMAEHLEKLIDAGVDSFKVEGRTKSVYYAAIVARTYRILFDQILSGQKPDTEWALRELNTTSNRGFMPGFLEGNPKEQAQDYEKKTSHQTHLFAGIVREVISSSKEKSELIIESRAKFSKGDILEFVTPTEIFEFECDNISREKMNKKTKVMETKELDCVSGGLEFNVKLVVPFEIKNTYCVIRRRLTEKEFLDGEA